MNQTSTLLPQTSSTLTLIQPDDWHLHLRDGAALAAVAPFTARVFRRAIVMPNLRQPVTTVAQAQAYRERILAAVAAGLGGQAPAFEPLMTIYLTSATDPAQIDLARHSGFVHGVKLYPARATTNSEAGVQSFEDCNRVFERMQDCGLPLLIHGEVTRPDVDVFDRERYFIDEVLGPLRRRFPGLRIVLEHVTTKDAVDFVAEASGPMAATITAHHLLYNRNAMFLTPAGGAGMRPHFYCLPIIKREVHRQALLQAATSGNPRFFLGTDSAPHPRCDKENACGCAGCFTAPHAIGMYAHAFESVGALHKLQGFASEFGPDFYGLPRNTQTITLQRAAAASTVCLDVQDPDRPGVDLMFQSLGNEADTWQLP
jgi:dihydroorotase